VIIISDSGPGIPHEIRERIFAPFFTTKEVGKGTGHGLSIATSIVGRHGGSLTLDSGPVTAFAIRLPIG
jgi:two-component system NtrC family sensor kinase